MTGLEDDSFLLDVDQPVSFDEDDYDEGVDAFPFPSRLPSSNTSSSSSSFSSTPFTTSSSLRTPFAPSSYTAFNPSPGTPNSREDTVRHTPHAGGHFFPEPSSSPIQHRNDHSTLGEGRERGSEIHVVDVHSSFIDSEDITRLEQPCPEALSFGVTLASFNQGYDDTRQGHSRESLLSLARTYAEACQERRGHLLTMIEHKYGAVETLHKLESKALASFLAEERHTWLLLQTLHQFGHHVSERRPNIHSLFIYNLNKQLLSVTPTSNQDVLLAVLVKQWLETILEHVDADTSAATWNHTQHQLHTRSASSRTASNSPYPSTSTTVAMNSNMVAEIDPDAPTRTGLRIHTEDQRNESILLHDVWRYVRAGCLPEAAELCTKKGQPWRSASMAGAVWMEALPLTEKDESANHVIDPHRKEWKTVCRALSQQVEAHEYERAIYGVLCGDLEAAISVCHTWHDMLWAHACTLVENFADDALNAITSSPSFDPTLLAFQEHQDINNYTNNNNNNNSIFTKDASSIAMSETSIISSTRSNSNFPNGDLQGRPLHKNLRISLEELRLGRGGVGGRAGEGETAEKPFHLIQSRLIEGRVDLVLESLANYVEKGLWEGRKVKLPDAAMLRFAAHFVLFTRDRGDLQSTAEEIVKIAERRQTGEEEKRRREQLETNILRSYVDHLIKTKQISLVALYVSTLPTFQQVPKYCEFLLGIEEKEEREECLLLAEKAGLSTTQITRAVVDLSKFMPVHDPDPTKQREVSLADEKKIMAVEWLCFDPSQRAHALMEINGLTREYILDGKMSAASMAMYQVLPADTMSLVRAGWGENKDDQYWVEYNAVREHFAMKDLLGALQSYEEWRCLPTAPPNLPSRTIDSSDPTWAYHQRQIAKWKSDRDAHMEEAGRALRQVLSFPGGWLIDAGPDIGSPKRKAELRNVRKTMLAQLVFRLHTIYTAATKYKECLELVQLVGLRQGDGPGVLADMSTTDQHELMKRMRDTAMSMLKAGFRPSEVPPK